MSTTFSRTTSLNGLAMVIAKRIKAIKDIAAEKGEQPKSGELAKQFLWICERSTLHGGPISTAEMCSLASDLVPAALENFRSPERLAA
jgi:hypothetical protein